MYSHGLRHHNHSTYLGKPAKFQGHAVGDRLKRAARGLCVTKQFDFLYHRDKLTFSRSAGQFEVDQAGYNYGGTAFANNTYLVGAGGFQGSGSGGPVTLTFATPVIQFGTNIEDFDLAGNGTNNPYFIDFQAFDPTGASLGNFTSTRGCSDNSCLSFEGLTVSGNSIGSISFYDSPSNLNSSSNNLLFGNVALRRWETDLQPPAAVTPEPSSLLLLRHRHAGPRWPGPQSFRLESDRAPLQCFLPAHGPNPADLIEEINDSPTLLVSGVIWSG